MTTHAAQDPVLQDAHSSSGEGHSLSSAFAGVQGLREILDELTICVLQIRSESVQKHERLLQLLKMRAMELCRTIEQITAKGAQSLLKRTFLRHLQVDGDFPEQARVMHCLLAADSCYIRRGT